MRRREAEEMEMQNKRAGVETTVARPKLGKPPRQKNPEVEGIAGQAEEGNKAGKKTKKDKKPAYKRSGTLEKVTWTCIVFGTALITFLGSNWFLAALEIALPMERAQEQKLAAIEELADIKEEYANLESRLTGSTKADLEELKSAIMDLNTNECLIDVVADTQLDNQNPGNIIVLLRVTDEQLLSNALGKVSSVVEGKAAIQDLSLNGSNATITLNAN